MSEALDKLKELNSQREAEDKLWQQLALNVIEVLPDAVVVVRPSGAIFRVNREAELMFGYTRAALQGQQVEILIPESRRPQHIGHRTNYAEQPRTRVMGVGVSELTALHSSGREFPVVITLSPLPTDDSGVFTITVVRRK